MQHCTIIYFLYIITPIKMLRPNPRLTLILCKWIKLREKSKAGDVILESYDETAPYYHHHKQKHLLLITYILSSFKITVFNFLFLKTKWYEYLYL